MAQSEMPNDAGELLARFEELTALEDEFDDADLEIIRHTNTLLNPIYTKRALLAQKLPHFWALVFEQAPPELDAHIQPSDSQLFGDALRELSVDRFEVNEQPRSYAIRFTFAENAYFEDKMLEKKFWHRRGATGWEGLVSEPVKIHWKKGKDLTGGLTDAAWALWEARTKLAESTNGSGSVNGAVWKKKSKELPEYQALVKKIHTAGDASMSFFTWFGFVSGYKYVSAAESAQAMKEEAARREQRKAGQAVEEPEDEDEEEGDDETEVFPSGEELATLLAEDIWPNAIKYYKSAHEQDDEELSEIDEDMEDDSSDEEVDIRALVGKGKKDSDSPPPKKRKV